MTAQADFIKQSEALSRQAWEAWNRQWQGATAAAPAPAPAAAPSVEEAIQRSLGSFTDYLDWLRRAATSGLGQPGGEDGWQALRNLFGAHAPAFGQPAGPAVNPFAGIDSASVQGLGQAWQNLLQSAGMGASGVTGDWRSALQTPAFGYLRESQEQQQALLLAIAEHQQASQRYQELLLRAQQQGAERLQRKLAEPGRKVETLKALYDLWVDAAEEAYAEIALSGEFRTVYGAQVNTQMRVRQLMQQQVEQACRELGMPTRSEVASLGQRLQELRREVRRTSTADGNAQIAALRAELAALKRQAGKPAAARTALAGKAAAKKATPRGRSAVKTPTPKPVPPKKAAKTAPTRGKAASRPQAPARRAARKRS